MAIPSSRKGITRSVSAEVSPIPQHPLRLDTSTLMGNMHCRSSKGEPFMSESSKRILTRREALLLSATAGIGVVAGKSALASDSIKTAAHQEPGNCSTPRSAVAKTQYGKVRGFLDGGVFTFKGVPYGQTTAGENRWLPAQPLKPWTDEFPALVYGRTARKTCTPGRALSRPSSRIGTMAGRVRTCSS